MALAPEMFEPQEPLNEDGDIEQHDWPETMLEDRRQAKFHAFALLKLMPGSLLDLVYQKLSYIKSLDGTKEFI